MKKKWLYLLLIFTLMLIISGWLYAYTYGNSLKAEIMDYKENLDEIVSENSQKVLTLEENIDDLNTKIINLQSDNEIQIVKEYELSEQVNELTDRLDAANDSIEAVNEKNQKLQATLDDKEHLLQSNIKQIKDAERQAERYKAMAICDLDTAPFKINFTSNSTVSNSLKDYLESTIGTIEKSEWEVVWNNSKVSIHKLSGEYLSVFLVYFDEPSLGYKQAIFDFAHQCYWDIKE